VSLVRAEKSATEFSERSAACPGLPLSVEQMHLEIDESETARIGRQRSYGGVVKRSDSANIPASSGPRLLACMSSTGLFRHTSRTSPTAVALVKASGPMPTASHRSW
jgi:hypothetical protein